MASLILARFAHIPPAPTPLLLTSNDAPTQEEEFRIKAYIERLDTMTNDSSRNHNPLSSYRARQLTDALRIHRALLRTGARRLPPEIIQHISLYMPLPWTLSQVCAAWRHATKDYKNLWSNLPTLELTAKKNEKPLKFIRFAQELLRRSGDNPLSVDIKAIEWAEKRPLHNFSLLQADRWVEARLELDSSVVVEFQRTASAMKRLRHLTIAVTRPTPDQRGADFRLNLKGLVSLRSLTKCTPWPVPPLSLPDGTIRSYIGKMWGADLPNLLNLLSPTLEILILTNNNFRVQPNVFGAELGPFLFPALREIGLYEGIYIFQCTFSPFQYMITPCLHTVRLSQCSPQTFASFCQMILRSGAGPTLTTLHIWSDWNDCIPYNYLSSIFADTPNLTDLKLSDRQFPSLCALSLLSTRTSDGLVFVLPNLKRLTVFVEWDTVPSRGILRSLHAIGVLRMESFSADTTTSTRRLQSFEVGLLSAVSPPRPDPPFLHQKQNRNRVHLDPYWQRDCLGGNILKTLEDITCGLRLMTENIQADVRQAQVKTKQFSDLDGILRRLRDLQLPLIQEVYVGCSAYHIHLKSDRVQLDLQRLSCPASAFIDVISGG